MDCETGGLKGTETILTVYMAMVNNNLEIIDELDLEIKPDDGNYIYSEEALMINGIDLKKHDQTAIPESVATQKIISFFEKHKELQSKFTVLGHNVTFDINFIQNKLINPETWGTFVNTDHVEDTLEKAKALRESGHLPKELSLALGSCAEYFFIRTFGLHNAKLDCLVTLDVYKKELELEKKIS